MRQRVSCAGMCRHMQACDGRCAPSGSVKSASTACSERYSCWSPRLCTSVPILDGICAKYIFPSVNFHPLSISRPLLSASHPVVVAQCVSSCLNRRGRGPEQASRGCLIRHRAADHGRVRSGAARPTGAPNWAHPAAGGRTLPEQASNKTLQKKPLEPDHSTG